MKYDCNPTCPSRKPFKKRPTRRGRAYMPPAHLAYTTNLTLHHSVGAGHARPAALPGPQPCHYILFNLKP